MYTIVHFSMYLKPKTYCNALSEIAGLGLNAPFTDSCLLRGFGACPKYLWSFYKAVWAWTSWWIGGILGVPHHSLMGSKEVALPQLYQFRTKNWEGFPAQVALNRRLSVCARSPILNLNRSERWNPLKWYPKNMFDFCTRSNCALSLRASNLPVHSQGVS